MNRRILAAKQFAKRTLTNTTDVTNRLKKSGFNATNYAPMGRTTSLKSAAKYVSPERIQAGAREAEREMAEYAKEQSRKTMQARALRKKQAEMQKAWSFQRTGRYTPK